jgi:3,4-dihydroxy 2-butanone 4-phosphate synthase/GTP cyclohydrolase II
MLNTIPQAIKDIKAGKVVIVVDDEDRENEGDFVTAAKNATPEIINFMAKHGRGLICAPLIENRCKELGLNLMIADNTALHETPFTVSIDLKGHGCTTGISAHDRAKTIQALVNPKTKPQDLAKPGHIFPLQAKTGGVLRRAGHTEAAIDLARLADFEPAGIIVEILNDDGTMARLPELKKIAKKFNLKIISIADLIKYRLKYDSLIERIGRDAIYRVSNSNAKDAINRVSAGVKLPTEYGDFNLVAYKQTTTDEIHLALIKGKWKKDEPILVRVHSSCATGDIFHSKRCDCGKQLTKSMQIIEKAGKGVILYMKQEGRGIGLLSKLKAYELQEKGLDTVEANLKLGYEMDERDYGVGAQILRDLGITKMRFMSNNPTKRVGLESYGLEIVEKVPLEIKPNKYNKNYLKTKRDKMGHEILKK